MTTQEIIQKFEQLTDDTTELSSSEELALAEKIYRKVLNDRAWEFLKTSFVGNVAGSTVTLPTDFAYIISNSAYTDISIGINSVSNPVVVFVGPTYIPYRVVNFSDRLQYRNQNNICWIDLKNNVLQFALPINNSITFDYIYNPPSLTTGTSPIFPSRFHDIISHGMASEDFEIQLFDKTRSYAQENQIKYNKYLLDMQYWNAQFNMN